MCIWCENTAGSCNLDTLSVLCEMVLGILFWQLEGNLVSFLHCVLRQTMLFLKHPLKWGCLWEIFRIYKLRYLNCPTVHMCRYQERWFIYMLKPMELKLPPLWKCFQVHPSACASAANLYAFFILRFILYLYIVAAELDGPLHCLLCIVRVHGRMTTLRLKEETRIVNGLSIRSFHFNPCLFFSSWEDIPDHKVHVRQFWQHVPGELYWFWNIPLSVTS